MRIAVVGAGIVGTAIAAELAFRGASVRVFEAQAPDATIASHGWLNATFGNAPDYVKLRLFAMEAWRALDLGPAVPLWCGSLSWEMPDDELDALIEGHAALGYPVRAVGREEIAARVPALAAPPDRAALAPGEGVLDAPAALAALRARAEQHGAEFVNAEVSRGASGRFRTADGPLDADRIVLAAGTGMRALTGLPVSASPGLIVRARPAVEARPLAHVLVAPGLLVAPAPDGSLILGGDAGGPNGTADPVAASARLLAETSTLLGGLELSSVDCRVGVRPMPSDGHPLVGPLPHLEDCYVAVTHSGATLAAGLAQLVAEELLDGRDAALLAPFRPGRADPTERSL